MDELRKELREELAQFLFESFFHTKGAAYDMVDLEIFKLSNMATVLDMIYRYNAIVNHEMNLDMEVSNLRVELSEMREKAEKYTTL